MSLQSQDGSMAVGLGSHNGFWVMLATALFLSACGEAQAPQTANAANPEEIVLNRGNAAEPFTLDPHQAGGTWENDIIGDMLMGLTTEAADATPIPGAAESWETSEDGLTWTFHLREHTWSDGVPVTAEDFVFAWQHILAPETAAAYAYFLYPIRNAEAVNSGVARPEELGVRAADDKTLVVELEHPAPYLEEFMTHYTTFPIPKHVVEMYGNAWTRPGNYVTNGPYILRDWVPNDHITLVKNPAFYDAESVSVDRIVFYPTSDYDAALRRFRAGEIDTQARLPSLQIDWLRQNMPEVLRIDPITSLEYITVNQDRPPFGDVRIREALSLTLNRELLTEQVIRVGHKPSYSIVPPGIANYEGNVALSFRDMLPADRIARAKMLMEEAGYGPNNRLKTSIEVRSAAPDARRVPAAIQQMWSEIYIDVEINQSDAAIFYKKVQEHDFDIAIAAWSADFSDAENFLYLLRTGSKENYGNYSNPEFDAILAQATQERDLRHRAELLASAERIALNDHAWIPFFSWVSTQIVRTYVHGWVNNPRAVNRTRWVSIDTAARAAQFPRLYGN
jgi:oligopeptide transport system substrate-binding protein